MDHRVEVTGRAEPQFPRSEPFPAGITIQVMARAGIPQSREASPPFPLETNPTERGLSMGKMAVTWFFSRAMNKMSPLHLDTYV